MIRILSRLSVLASILALTLPVVMVVLKYAIADDRSAWYFGDPDIAKPYICKKVQNGMCESAWRSFQGHCYTAVGDAKTRSEARHSCDAMHSYLVSIHSDAENSHVSTTCMGLVGLPDDEDGRPSCFIGLTQTATAWDDGSEVNYTNWGRAPKLVGNHEAVTVNGNWIVGGILDFISLGINAVVMCGSAACLLYARRTRSEAAFKQALVGEALGSVFCIATFALWVPGRPVKDPARSLPLIALCVLQEVTTLCILCYQFCCAGLEPKWDAAALSNPGHVRTVSTAVQPQIVPHSAHE